MEIEIIMQSQDQLKEIDLNQISSAVSNGNMDDVVILDAQIKEQTEETIENTNDNQHSNQIFTSQNIIAIIDNVINDVCDYLTEHTDFEHMKDSMINTRMRILMREKYDIQLTKDILGFIEFLQTDDTIQEALNETNNKLTYNSNITEDIHTYINEFLCLNMAINTSALAYGWLNWNDAKGIFCSNSIFDSEIQDYVISRIIKYVFRTGNALLDNTYKGLKSDNGVIYEFIEGDVYKNADSNADSNAESEKIESESDDDDTTQKNECILS